MRTAESITIEITVPPQQSRQVHQLLAGVREGVPRVLTRAINKVGVAARTKVIRRVCAELTLTASQVRNRNVTLRKANYRTLAARLQIAGRRVPLRRFQARQIRTGVRYAIRRGQRQTIPHAFLARMQSGHEGVFLRTGLPQPPRRRRPGQDGGVRPRKPINERYGPSVPQAVEDIEEISRDVLREAILDDLAGEVDTQIGLVLQRHGRTA